MTLRVQLDNRQVVAAEDDTHIDSEQRIRHEANPSNAELRPNPLPGSKLTATYQNVGAISRFRRVLEKNHVVPGVP